MVGPGPGGRQLPKYTIGYRVQPLPAPRSHHLYKNPSKHFGPLPLNTHCNAKEDQSKPEDPIGLSYSTVTTLNCVAGTYSPSGRARGLQRSVQAHPITGRGFRSHLCARMHEQWTYRLRALSRLQIRPSSFSRCPLQHSRAPCLAPTPGLAVPVHLHCSAS